MSDMEELVRKGWWPTGGKGHGLDVEDDDGDALLLEQPDNGGADAARTAGDNDNLPGPVVGVVDPVVADAVGEPAADGAGEGDVEEAGQAAVGDGVQDGQVLALLGVAGEQQQGEEDAGVEGGGADDLEDDVEAEALAGEEASVHRHGGWVMVVVIVVVVMVVRGKPGRRRARRGEVSRDGQQGVRARVG